MLNVVRSDKLLELNQESGQVLLSGLEQIENRFPELMASSRGIGTFCAFDCPTVETRLATKQTTPDMIMIRVVLAVCQS